MEFFFSTQTTFLCRPNYTFRLQLYLLTIFLCVQTIYLGFSDFGNIFFRILHPTPPPPLQKYHVPSLINLFQRNFRGKVTVPQPTNTSYLRQYMQDTFDFVQLSVTDGTASELRSTSSSVSE